MYIDRITPAIFNFRDIRSSQSEQNLTIMRDGSPLKLISKTPKISDLSIANHQFELRRNQFMGIKNDLEAYVSNSKDSQLFSK